MPPSKVSATLAGSRMGVLSIVFFTVAAGAPATIVGGVAANGFAVAATPGLPLGYLVVALVVGVFAIGYVTMSRHVDNAGAFYAYIAKGLGRAAGAGAGAVAVVSYLLILGGLVGGFGVGAADFARRLTGADPTWWWYSAAAIALVAALGLQRIDVNGRVLALLLLAEVTALVVYDVAFVAAPGPEGLTFGALDPSVLLTGSAGAILLVAFTGFIGFANLTVLAREARDPRTVIHAAAISLLVIGGLFSASTWAMTVATGPGSVVAAADRDSTRLLFALAAQRLPATLVDVGNVLYLTSMFAAALAFHHVCARYLFSLGLEGVGARWWVRTSARTGAPVAGSLVATAVSAAAVAVTAVLELDPAVHLFSRGATTGALGVLLLVLLTSVAVVGFFRRTGGHGHGAWPTTIAPALAAALLALVLVAAVLSYRTTLGVAPGHALGWVVPSGLAGVFAVGSAWGMLLKRAKPEVYARIGAGARATVMRSPEALARR
ncbi:APC family permease [Saccharopolyspora sp. TS4A08]|uniref:APC family permease n=1 Tax=Saccharopolyspora ipomoeae TaxID=3042027 RepID=A0ABT6PJF5_9PSEU|nr:APC family permease [Saccharopolyspora sp. TS4A08]MDI2028108.1 APC family permease [Saccharopolyspora sp. TS4A08]